MIQDIPYKLSVSILTLMRETFTNTHPINLLSSRTFDNKVSRIRGSGIKVVKLSWNCTSSMLEIPATFPNSSKFSKLYRAIRYFAGFCATASDYNHKGHQETTTAMAQISKIREVKCIFPGGNGLIPHLTSHIKQSLPGKHKCTAATRNRI